MLAIDKMTGDLQAAVAAAGQKPNTYFVFSSDNGLHMGEHRLMPGKMSAFDTDIRVPLIVSGPQVAGERVVDEVVENIDLCPTFANLQESRSPRPPMVAAWCRFCVGKRCRTGARLL